MCYGCYILRWSWLLHFLEFEACNQPLWQFIQHISTYSNTKDFKLISKNLHFWTIQLWNFLNWNRIPVHCVYAFNLSEKMCREPDIFWEKETSWSIMFCSSQHFEVKMCSYLIRTRYLKIGSDRHLLLWGQTIVQNIYLEIKVIYL